MISGIRHDSLTLACKRHGRPTVHGKGIDQLPGEVTARFAGSLVRHLEAEELRRAFRAAVEGLIYEIRCADEGLAARLQQALRQLTEDTMSA